MVSNWMLSRFRSAFLSENLTLLVLRLLKDSELGEWEILSQLHSRYGFTPSAKEFQRLERDLLAGGYATVVSLGETNRMQITTMGIGLLVKLEKEYQSLTSAISPK